MLPSPYPCRFRTEHINSSMGLAERSFLEMLPFEEKNKWQITVRVVRPWMDYSNIHKNIQSNVRLFILSFDF